MLPILSRDFLQISLPFFPMAKGHLFLTHTNQGLIAPTFPLKASGTHTGTTTIDVVQIADAKGLRLPTKSANPASSNAAGQSISAGTIFYSNTYLYIATDSNTIKRVALNAF